MRSARKKDSAKITWTVSELGSLFTQNKAPLVSYAFKRLGDKSRAEEIVQDALVRVILAAPELSSPSHALAYMYKTIENSCLDQFRLEGRRPNLVLLEDASPEMESIWIRDYRDNEEMISEANDAAIVRQALAMLSPAERVALVMWEIEGRSTGEIASALGIKNSAVRHAVSRARSSLRRTLSEFIVDEKRGLTALDMLSVSLKKTEKTLQKVGKSTAVLLFIFVAFIGLESFSENAGTTEVLIATPQLGTKSQEPPAAVAETNAESDKRDGIKFDSKSVSRAISSGESRRTSEYLFPGLDKNGLPTSFTIADSSGESGSLFIKDRPVESQIAESSMSQMLKTDSGAANLFITQKVFYGSNGWNYEPIVSYGRDGVWVPLVTQVSNLKEERLSSGNYLLSVNIKVESEVESSIIIPATAGGRDLIEAPKQILIRLILNEEKALILTQAVFVVEKSREW